MSTSGIVRAAGLSALSRSYNAVFCDIWGVIHNGISVFPEAPEALRKFRAETGGTVILLTNAPRPDWWVERQLDALNVPREAYDAIVTSGDATRHAMLTRQTTKVFALGPEKDRNFYDGLPISLVTPQEADLVCVTGLIDDESETPEDYEAMLASFLERDLTVICANPDIVVERGDRLVYCGGALAELYREMGGKALYFGKPHKPIYDRAMLVAKSRKGCALTTKSVLAIGDGIKTDVKGANEAGLDCLFVTGGIHSAQAGPLSDATSETVQKFLNDEGREAVAFLPRLYW